MTRDENRGPNVAAPTRSSAPEQGAPGRSTTWDGRGKEVEILLPAADHPKGAAVPGRSTRGGSPRTLKTRDDSGRVRQADLQRMGGNRSHQYVAEGEVDQGGIGIHRDP